MMYQFNLAGLSIACPLNLVMALLSETNTKQPQSIVISCLHTNMCFSKCLQLTNQRPQLVSSDIHSPEVCKNVPSLDIFSPQPNLPEKNDPRHLVNQQATLIDFKYLP